MKHSLFILKVRLSFFSEVNVVKVLVVCHMASKTFLHPVVYVIFLSVHEDVFVKKTDFFKHLLADEETGTREIHIAGYIIVKASA